jgi:membrane protein
MTKIKEYFHRIKDLIVRTYKVWSANDPWTLSAAISYYTIISLPAILVIILSITGYFYSEQTVQDEINSQITELIGQESAAQVMRMIDSAQLSATSFWATLIGIVTLIFSATGVFLQLQRALNRIWDIRIKSNRALLKLLIDRAFTLSAIVILGFLMLVSLVISSLISIFSGIITEFLNIEAGLLYSGINGLFTFLITTFVFMLMFRILPDARVKWKYLAVGAVITALLFGLGIWLIELYIGRSDPGSTYGAAGSLVLILVWVAYSSLIFLFGAAFTRVYAESMGEVKTTAFAEKINEVVVEKK